MTAEAVEKAIDVEVDKLASEGPGERELQKAKNQAIAAYYRGLRSINGRASAIGDYEVLFGDWHKLSGVEGEYAKITAADVQRVMKKYLIKTNRTVATLVPTAAPAAGAAGEAK